MIVFEDDESRYFVFPAQERGCKDWVRTEKNVNKCFQTFWYTLDSSGVLLWSTVYVSDGLINFNERVAFKESYITANYLLNMSASS